MIMAEPRALKEILTALAAKSSWAAPQATERVAAVWERIAPRGLAAHCWVSSLVRGVLELSSDAPVWAQEVRMVSPELAVRLNQEMGADVVQSIVVTVRRRRSDRRQGNSRV